MEAWLMIMLQREVQNVNTYSLFQKLTDKLHLQWQKNQCKNISKSLKFINKGRLGPNSDPVHLFEASYWLKGEQRKPHLLIIKIISRSEMYSWLLIGVSKEQIPTINCFLMLTIYKQRFQKDLTPRRLIAEDWNATHWWKTGMKSNNGPGWLSHLKLLIIFSLFVENLLWETVLTF